MINLGKAIRELDERIARDMDETVDVVKFGYRCIGEECVIYKRCMEDKKERKRLKLKRGECGWDLRNLETSKPRTIETSRHRNPEASKNPHKNPITSKHRNIEPSKPRILGSSTHRNY